MRFAQFLPLLPLAQAAFSTVQYQWPSCGSPNYDIANGTQIACTAVTCVGSQSTDCGVAAIPIPTVGLYAYFYGYGSMNECNGATASPMTELVWKNGTCFNSVMYVCNGTHIVKYDCKQIPAVELSSTSYNRCDQSGIRGTCFSPTPRPTEAPVKTSSPTAPSRATEKPTPETSRPTSGPTTSTTPKPTPDTPKPTPEVTKEPTSRPTNQGDTREPTRGPTPGPTRDTPKPTPEVTKEPTSRPTNQGDTREPTRGPTPGPTRDTPKPTPEVTKEPTSRPTNQGDTREPTPGPTRDTPKPTPEPTTRPTKEGETFAPTEKPTNQGDSRQPTVRPTDKPVDIVTDNSATSLVVGPSLLILGWLLM